MLIERVVRRHHKAKLVNLSIICKTFIQTIQSIHSCLFSLFLAPKNIRLWGRQILQIYTRASMSFRHLVLVGFDHADGNRVEYAHPPLPSAVAASLAFVALPDRVHLRRADHIFFALDCRAISNNNQNKNNNNNKNNNSNNDEDDSFERLWGVALFCQRAAESLESRSHTLSRPTVAQSLVVLLDRPAFGRARACLRPLASAFFAQRALDDWRVLEHGVAHLARTLPPHAALSRDDVCFCWHVCIFVFFIDIGICH